jgi:hypothetical protein
LPDFPDRAETARSQPDEDEASMRREARGVREFVQQQPPCCTPCGSSPGLEPIDT